MSATMIVETPEAVREQVIAWRRHLHQHPELSFHERETSQFVADTLAALSGIIAGAFTVAAIVLSGTSVAKLAPWLPQIKKDLNIGVVALLVNIAVIVLVSAFVRRPPLR